jgi:hypothetical protein
MRIQYDLLQMIGRESGNLCQNLHILVYWVCDGTITCRQRKQTISVVLGGISQIHVEPFGKIAPVEYHLDPR